MGKLENILQPSSVPRLAVVHGLGGIGKTQLATTYVYRHRTDHSAVLWLDARDESALKQSYSRLAEWVVQHQPSVHYVAGALKSQDLDEIVMAMKRWLDEPMNRNWLAVYDNYDSPALSDHDEMSMEEPSCASATGYGHDESVAKPFSLRLYLPKSDNGAIIITTRSSMVKLGQGIHLRKLKTLDESLQILERASGRDDLKQGKQV